MQIHHYIPILLTIVIFGSVGLFFIADLIEAKEWVDNKCNELGYDEGTLYEGTWGRQIRFTCKNIADDGRISNPDWFTYRRD